MATVPEHLHDIPAQREAFAPYNFIPLPEKAVPAEVVSEQQRVVIANVNLQPKEAQYLVRHDQYFADRHTGTISCTLKTETPLYVRCGLTAEEFKRSLLEVEQQQQSNEARTAPTKNKPDFFASPSQRAVIPGSSLRGLMRSLVEIVSHSKIDLVTRKHLFYRSVGKDRLGLSYRKQIGENVLSGFLTFNDDGGSIEQVARYKVHHDVLNSSIPEIFNRKGTITFPNDYQYQKIWVLIENSEVSQISLYQPNDTRWLSAILVLTGSIPKKKRHEFVFIEQSEQNTFQNTFQISRDLIEQFHDEDQLTQWQKKSFPKGTDGREYSGWLRKKNQPIFFIVDPADPQQVSFFGRAGMFRLPYTHSPYDLIPLHLRVGSDDALVDMTEAMFGFVRREQDDNHKKPDDANPAKQITSYASRLRFSDAKLVNQQISDSQLWDTTTAITPPILSSPKPTTFQHYLTQKSARKDELLHYGDNLNDTTIRGYKQYWNQGKLRSADLNRSAGTDSTQTTRMRPVKSGVEFQFQIAFENLSDVELGALIYVLELAASSNHRLKLGMGKPFGFGSIAINYQITTTSRQDRYRQLFNPSQHNWLRAERDWLDEDLLAKRQAFCGYILQQSGEQERGFSEFNQLPRIKQLLKMLEWNENFEPEDYMTLQDFRKRKILPKPLNINRRRKAIIHEQIQKPLKAGNDVMGKVIDHVGRYWIVQLDNRDLVYRATLLSSIDRRDIKIGKRVLIRIKSLADDAVQEIRKIQ